ncbi:hypothetical protein BJY24_005779 [Nocardia transvalensis]|uniref:Uncharacterized protein n=1 Tax=Nocardia transvalensis TaxID=37333 RepID=A0A7W9PIM3_9NOCA|nr:hypothetical protein [Nocardia transvalensis]MBB5916867.1 hypothetical protein [Nocardia transvalensis]
MTDPWSYVWNEEPPVGATGIPATRIPLWQRRLLADIQNAAAAHSAVADEGPGRWGDSGVWESNLHVLNRKVSALIDRAKTLEVPARWIITAFERGEQGNEWTADTRLPDAGQGRDEQLRALYRQVVVVEDMAVIDAERRYRHAHDPATATDPYPGDPDSYLDRTFRRNIALRWLLASVYADAITATDAEREQLWATVTADRPRRTALIHAQPQRVLDKRWRAYASPPFAAVSTELFDALEPDPANDPGQPLGHGFPTPHTLLALATEHIHATATRPDQATSPDGVRPADIDHHRTTPAEISPEIPENGSERHSAAGDSGFDPPRSAAGAADAALPADPGMAWESGTAGTPPHSAAPPVQASDPGAEL